MSGLVVVCPDQSAETLRPLRRSAHFTIGPEQPSGRVPVVLETETHDEHRTQLEWLRRLPGVATVELIHADYREATEEATTDVR